MRVRIYRADYYNKGKLYRMSFACDNLNDADAHARQCADEQHRYTGDVVFCGRYEESEYNSPDFGSFVSTS